MEDMASDDCKELNGKFMPQYVAKSAEGIQWLEDRLKLLENHAYFQCDCSVTIKKDKGQISIFAGKNSRDALVIKSKGKDGKLANIVVQTFSEVRVDGLNVEIEDERYKIFYSYSKFDL